MRYLAGFLFFSDLMRMWHPMTFLALLVGYWHKLALQHMKAGQVA